MENLIFSPYRRNEIAVLPPKHKKSFWCRLGLHKKVVYSPFEEFNTFMYAHQTKEQRKIDLECIHTNHRIEDQIPAHTSYIVCTRKGCFYTKCNTKCVYFPAFGHAEVIGNVSDTIYIPVILKSYLINKYGKYE